MYIGHIMYRKKRGVSTVLGTLIFVGILFTAVTPMLLVMKQADTVYEQKKLEIQRFDEEKAREMINVWVYPTNGSTSQNITVSVDNICALDVKIMRVWVNDSIRQPNTTLIESMSEQQIGTYYVNPQENSTYDVKVMTERGNIFESGTGPLSWYDSMWQVETLMINVLISSPGVVFKIEVTGPSSYYEEAMVWKIGGSAFKSFDVTDPGNGNYNVKVFRSSTIIQEEDVIMEWPDGPPVIWVYA